MRARAFFFLLVLLMTAAYGWSASTASAPHLSVQLVVPPAEIYPGQSFTAGLYFRLEPGWHVYWINAGDSGEPPHLRWTLPKQISAGPMQFPVPKRLPLGPLMDFGYENEVLFPVPMHVGRDFRPPADGKLVLGAKADWLVCREVCIPGKAQLDVERKALAAQPDAPGLIDSDEQLMARMAGTLPKPLPAGMQARFLPTATGFSLTVLTGERETAAEFFPFEQNQMANAAPQKVTPLKNGVRIDIKKDENLQKLPDVLHGLVVLAGGRAFDVNAVQGTLGAQADAAGSAGMLARVLWLAFLGGIVLNLMPCVFPVLFIKGLSLLHSSAQERRKLRVHGLVYTLGILVSFWFIVALLLLLRAGGRQLGWGFQFQSSGFVAMMALLLFFLGLSLAGMFEIGLSLTSVGSGLAAKEGNSGSFFTGVLAVIVATPCTAPFMGAAIGYALAHSALVSFLVFTALAVGLAAPYLLLTFQPAWTRVLPRPGVWMELLKQATAIPVFGTVIWLVWLFTQTAGANALTGLLSGFVLLAVAGWILGRWPARRTATIAAVLVALGAAAVSLVSASRLAEVPVRARAAATSEWQPFSPGIVARFRQEGRPVFVDFTAKWCLSCQVNERVILQRADVQQKFRQGNFALVRADWTNSDEAITQALNALGRSGVPTYAVYAASSQDPPQVLPEVLTPGIVLHALDEAQGRH
ncbi:protein-disulfide reductase DsbD family protein [Pseudacidobacterium ailaaui]|jgi:thiol:disulfide interchange protein DsbD|uniref:protein-disulfide reductase DsbD family protein n=1 Tax=Pseudacidobacterium ailaaui TaxID=1382359 RepID=UPI0005D1702C|nr:thioredoxin family protein [Pseudacidobacterium ailaaui]